MTWRRFWALLRGLSPSSAFNTARQNSHAQNQPQVAASGSEEVRVIDDPVEAERAVLHLLQGG